MATESTLLIVKPDGVRRGLIGEVLRRVEAKGLTIDEMRMFTIAARDRPRSTTASIASKPFFGELVDFITGRAGRGREDHGRATRSSAGAR